MFLRRAFKTAQQTRSLHVLPKLPYPLENGLAPAISPRALDFHYNKHHQTYVNNANKLLAGTPLENEPLESVIKVASKDPSKVGLFNNVAQIYNHSFFWDCMTPSYKEPSSALTQKLEESFGSVTKFKEQFSAAALGQFGSGWAWLVSSEGKLKIVTTPNAGCPITSGDVPLLTCDVWEHAYYLDHQNRRAEYVENWWKVVNWQFVENQLTNPKHYN